MLRGLLIRQAFFLGNWVLVLLLLAGAGFAAFRFIGTHPVAETLLATEQSAEGPGSGGALSEVKPRGEYEAIVTSGLFGSAGSNKPAPPPPVEPQENLQPTELRLKLCGTSATSPKDLFASAIILNEEKNQVGAFCVGQEVVEKVTLEEVYQRKVVLFNKNKNKREVLLSDEEPKSSPDGGSTPPPSGASAAAAPGNRMTLKKQEIVKDLVMNYTDIVSKIKPELYHDDQGNVAGITASNIEQLPIAQKLGVKEGDVLQTVNNEPIDSEEKIMELVNKYRNSSTFRIGLLRNGKPVVVTYKLE